MQNGRPSLQQPSSPDNVNNPSSVDNNDPPPPPEYALILYFPSVLTLLLA